MLGKNLKYYRLKNNMTKRALADAIGVTPMAITNYENGDRNPNMDTLKLLANALNIKVTDFLANTGGELQFSHGKFRKGSKLGVMNQEYIRETVEEYFGRFFQVVSFLGGQKVLEPVPEIKKIPWMDDTENASKELRKYLGISINGPVPTLVEILENKGNVWRCLDLSLGKEYFLVTDGVGHYAHGSTIQQAEGVLRFKFGHRTSPGIRH